MPKIVEHISLAIGVIGVSVILWGVLLGVLRLVRLEWASLTGRDSLVEREDLRHHLGYYLLLGLEFLIAADRAYTREAAIRPNTVTPQRTRTDRIAALTRPSQSVDDARSRQIDRFCPRNGSRASGWRIRQAGRQ